MTNTMSLRNSVLLAVGVMLAMVLVYAGEASAIARHHMIDQGCPPGASFCSGGTTSPPTTTTTSTVTAPYVTQVSPQDGASGVSRNANVKVTFSEEMDPNTVNGTTFQLHTYDTITYGWLYYTEQIPATVSKDPTDATGRTWVLDPYGATSSTLLSANRKYRVTLTTGVRDLKDGLPLPSEKKWYFTTGSS